MTNLAPILAVASLGLVCASSAAAVRYMPLSATAQTGLASVVDRDQQTITTFGDAVATTVMPFDMDGFNPNSDDQKNATATSHIHFAADEIDMSLSLNFDASQDAPDLLAQGEFAFNLASPASLTFDSSGFSLLSLGLQGSSSSPPSMLDDSGHLTLPAGEYDYFAYLDPPLLTDTTPFTRSASLSITFAAAGVGAILLPEPTSIGLLAAPLSLLCLRRRRFCN